MKIEAAIKQNTFINLRQKAALNLLYTASWLTEKQIDFFKTFGTTPHQFNILRILKGQHPTSISAKEIKLRMLDKNSDVSRLLDRLASKELIVRNVCPNDKRAMDINITPKGLSLLMHIGEKIDALESVLNLCEEDAGKLSDMLDQCRS